MSEHNGEEIFVQLETENLILKPIDMSDKEFIYKHFSNSDVCRFLLDADDLPFTDMKEAETLIDLYITSAPQRHNRWVIIRKSDSAPIGTCGYHNWDTHNNISEIGYDLSREYWGEGYMTEALYRSLRVGFENMGLNRIQAFVYVQNTRSADLLLRLGFTNEGIIKDKHFFRGKYYDHFCFSLLKREWNK